MRSNKLIFLAFILLSSTLKAQFYFKPSAGYSFSTNPSIIESYTIIDNSKSAFKTKIKCGQGFNVGLSAGFHLGKYLIIEASTRYLLYSKQSFSNNLNLNESNNYSWYGYFGEYEYSSKMFSITPQLGFNIPKDKFNICLKVGPNYMRSSFSGSQNTGYSEIANYPTEYTISYIPSIGLQTNLEFGYTLTEKLKITMDLLSVYNNCKVKKSDRKRSFSHAGIDLGIKYVINN